MARYTGPKCRLCRREGLKLYLKGQRCYDKKCAVTSRGDNYPPGMHAWRRGSKMSEFGLQLREKQRLKRMFGILEKQFRKTFGEARRSRENTGKALLSIVQRRLDFVVRTAGWGYGPNSARQVVSHGLLRLNGRKVTVPSIQVKAGDVITVAKREKTRKFISGVQEASAAYRSGEGIPDWLEVDAEKLVVKVNRLPMREEFPLVEIREQLIVEGLSK